LLRAHSLCMQIHPIHSFDHNMFSKSDFGENPIVVAFFYSTLSNITTSQNNWLTFQIFKFKYGGLSIFLYRLILYSFHHCFLPQKWILWSYLSTKDHLDTTLTQYQAYLNLVDLVHIIHIQIEHLSKVCYVPNNVFSESCGVDLIHTIAHFHTPCCPINPLIHILKYHSVISNLSPT
jgi:hypothetical protein